MEFGQVHHIEYYVNDLKSSNEFWSWFLSELGYRKSAEFPGGVSWAHRSGTYLIFVQVTPEHQEQKNSRQGNGLNHIAFQGRSEEQVQELKKALAARGIKIIFEDATQICFEDPNGFAVEVYVPRSNVD
jgi:catechol 2,3-dioxygenase-like lactoylglutathione lyase family enzyme